MRYQSFAFGVASAASATLIAASVASAGFVSFEVDPDTLTDTNMDGFVNGTDFAPVGDDGVVFTLEPTDNLVGGDRFLLSDDKGIHFGGGGGSTLQFEFTTDQPIELISYTLADSGFFLGNPLFDILDGGSPLSEDNDADADGATVAFNDGPVTINANQTYTFDVTVPGAGIQSFMSGWTYRIVPAPQTALVGLVGLAGLARRRRG